MTKELLSKEELKKLSDQEIVKLVFKEKNYFDEIVFRYEEKLFRYLQRLLSFKIQDSEDALNETFLKVYINLKGYNPSLKFSSWVYRIAHNEAINLIKKNSKWLVFNNDFFDFSDVNYDPKEKFLNNDLIEKILGELNFNERNLITLFYLENLSLKQIAEILKITENNAKVKLLRARNKAKLISKKYDQN